MVRKFFSVTLGAFALAALLAPAGVAGPKTVKGMPLNGVVRGVTYNVHQTVTGASAATITHDGTDVVFSDSISTTGMTVAGPVALGSNVPTMVTSRTVHIPATAFGLGGAADPAAELKNGKFTYAFADAAANDIVYITWPIPDDFALGTSGLIVKPIYMCDNATLTEGEFEIGYLAVADGDADAALTAVLTVLDTPAAQNTWQVSAPGTIHAVGFAAGDRLVHLSLAHDVSDPLCNAQAINVLGVDLVYTSSKNY